MDAEKLYQHLVAINNAEQQTYWTRYSIQAAINTAAVGAYAAGFKDAHLTRFWLMALPFGGLALSVMWCSITGAGNHWIDFWQDQLREVEKRWLASEELPRPFTLAANRRHDPSVRDVALGLAALFALGWFALEIIAWTRYAPLQ